MIVGVPKEIKNGENRVGITPTGVKSLVMAGHQVLVGVGAGLASGIEDAQMAASGATLLEDAAEIWSRAEMVVKVKEPLPAEYDYLRQGQVLFTYLHLASDERLTEELLQRRVVAIGYETIQTPDGLLPSLIPMSEIAGRLAPQIGASLLESHNGGRGILLGGVPGVPPADVVIVGCGFVGMNAAKIAMGMGAHVTLLDVNHERLRAADDIFHGNCFTLHSNPHTLERAASYADLLIGAVLLPGARAPVLVTEDMVRSMKSGSVILDVAVDQGGCVETIRPTTHAEPTYIKHGVIHYGVPNMPARVPRTSTFALTNRTLSYALEIANQGFAAAARQDPAIAKGIQTLDGKVVHRAVAESLNLRYEPLERLL